MIIPPLPEQQRIVSKIEELFSELDKIDKAQEIYDSAAKQLREKVLDCAMRGKLVPQDPNDEPASELLKRIEDEKQRLIKEKGIKKQKPLPKIEEEDKPFDIPSSWEWVRLGETSNIVRGGSPRPIKKYLTGDLDGINWIKIGDAENDSKYIKNTKEKILKSGLSKTRFVEKGTFLLTNSMSFGKPYILQCDGAIHDGWLAIHSYQNFFNRDFLYYLLSSEMIYNQFEKLSSGSVVKNLNKEKVKSAIIPLPPLSEQQQIVKKIESILEYL